MSLKRPRECDCTGVPEFMQNETTYIILGAENKIGSSYQIVIETGVTIRDFHYRGKKKHGDVEKGSNFRDKARKLSPRAEAAEEK